MEFHFWNFQNAMLGYHSSKEFQRRSLKIAVKDNYLLRRIGPDLSGGMHLLGEQFITGRQKFCAIGENKTGPIGGARRQRDHHRADLVDNPFAGHSISAQQYQRGALYYQTGGGIKQKCYRDTGSGEYLSRFAPFQHGPTLCAE